MEHQGASPNEIMLALCRGDQEDELEVLLGKGECDVSFTDGAGNSAAHIAVKVGSIGCLEVLVNHDEVDIDICNTIQGETPLHLAVQYANNDHEMGAAMVDLLLAAGADPTIVDRNKMTPIMICNPKFKDILEMLEGARVAATVDDSDIAHDDEDDEEGEGSGSGSEDEEEQK
ncbi:ankyrin repeat-containing domain protein [Thamnidium elegans]|uniref:Uncharacterized protein n=1 Tax=Thamnidium elegans TaxID=101142 RepID=A0A8H7SN02_9FUNG|nr:hypothetical protein INT48_006831 [Thamnidium elegans]KAI8095976.1 ankyrin repeat-containing domain protein [Thamnidium elegans]